MERLSTWFAVGLLMLPTVVCAEEPGQKPGGRGFVFGGAFGGGQLSFPGGSGQAMAVSPVNGELVIGLWGSALTLGQRDAKIVRAGQDVPGAEQIVPLPAHEGAFSFSMNGGYAFDRRVAVLLELEVSGGSSNSDFNHTVGSFVVRYWPATRVWAQAGPAFGDLGYGIAESAVRSGSITGNGVHLAAGVSVVRKPKWSLDLEARYATIWYEGFRASTATVAIAGSKLPL